MKARSKLLLLAMALSPLVVICGACGVAFAPIDDAPEGGAGDAADAGVVQVGANEDVEADGGSEEAATRDGASAIDAAGCTCDCDNDTFQASTNGCDGGPGPGPDCDDLDELVKPTAGFVASPWTSPHLPVGDWNCDGATTKKYDYNQKCNDVNNCNGKAGFNDDPSCGQTATFNTCLYNPGILGVLSPTCKVGSAALATQACK
jgi:hypothetical protein